MGENLTIIDIARLAGVSKSTVSRVLNNEPNVKPKTKEVVLRVIGENGYLPNEMARTLVKSKSKLVGLITPFQCRSFYRNEYFRDVFTGLSNVFKAQAYDILTASGSGVELDTIKKFALTYHVCGIVLLYSIPDDPSLHYLVDNRIPFSLIGACEGFSDINQVTYNFRAAMREIMETLIRQGRHKIAFFASDTGLATTRAYLDGYTTALAKAGLPLLEHYLAGGLDDEAAVCTAMERFRHSGQTPDAVIVSADAICLDLLRYCRRKGIRVPGDLAVFSLENGPSNEILDISSLDLDYIEMGALAGKMLADTMQTGKTNRIELRHRVIHRGSSLG
ncbi:LacI family transcriptional regulator [Pseudoflavonifractor sp. 524-17]|uniref:LacI family DNA-binding transcriptional regulator n=1 Tax=Pseudoflavonifractor sp. 524-17 TaxID=2304577 RepID=UPI00137B751F|nr:LacI family DNA-binding transcriptional regulator [Pseudoflavonifractor sp. 524-17]NCE65063.1 LacI family transcriptional regulator [Pseudoflavonifractor sp. 524-17]